MTWKGVTLNIKRRRPACRTHVPHLHFASEKRLKTKRFIPLIFHDGCQFLCFQGGQRFLHAKCRTYPQFERLASLKVLLYPRTEVKSGNGPGGTAIAKEKPTIDKQNYEK
jgi:hypothetical protein